MGPRTLDQAPEELQIAVREFWPPEEWDNAASISWLESGWDAFALGDTTDDNHPCGTPLFKRDGVVVTAERSVGWFQVNSCNFPGWEWQRLYNTRHNAGTAHALWDKTGWHPWYFSAKILGLL